MEERKDIETLLREDEVISPAKNLIENAHVKDYDQIYQRSLADPEGFWAEAAAELEWFQPWEKVLHWDYPFAQWFVGAKCNIVHNALDRHIKTWRRNKVALIWEGEPGEVKVYSYLQLYQEVNKFASVLKGLGVKKGDRVTIYMPRIPEQVMAMLACAKLGAIHSVVYGGFSGEALSDRIVDAESRFVITADGGYRNGKVIELKNICDQAVSRVPFVKSVIVVRRVGHQVPMVAGRDQWYDELINSPLASANVATEVMDAEDPLYILYTSGTTGKPKGVMHVHGGYMVGVHRSLKWVFDIKDEDTYFCTADPGWVTGHSYIVYGPLLCGTTSLMYEGGPSFPDPGRWWSLVENHRVSLLYTTPTAIRGLMRSGDEWPGRYDLSSLRLLGTVGEPINPKAWRWYYKTIGKERCPIMDTWWQTETGMFMITPLPCLALKPGSASRPFPGIDADVVDEKGRPVGANKGGQLVIKRPWPAMLKTIYKDPDRYREVYWDKIPGVYTTGDSARKDEDGYFWIMGRMDDVIKVSGYRLGTAEIESALVSHPAVAEAAVIAKPHDIKGNVIIAFVTLKASSPSSDEMKQELIAHVGHVMGPIAKPAQIRFIDLLPKTRSGKIMRRVLKAREMGIPEGDISTLED